MPPLEAFLRHPLVCLLPSGRPPSHEYVIRVLCRAGLNSHSFRHTSAACLVETCAKPVAVSARLGHADASITMNLCHTILMKRSTRPLEFSSSLLSSEFVFNLLSIKTSTMRDRLIIKGFPEHQYRFLIFCDKISHYEHQQHQVPSLCDQMSRTHLRHPQSAHL